MWALLRAAVAALLVMSSLAAGVAQAETPRPARDFTESICVNGHLSYWNWSYGYYHEVLDRLRELGVSCFRDGINPREIDGSAYDLAGRLDYLGDHGIRLNLIVGLQQRGPDNELEVVDDPADTVAMIRRRIRNVESVEGLNEPDVGFYSGAARASTARFSTSSPTAGPAARTSTIWTAAGACMSRGTATETGRWSLGARSPRRSPFETGIGCSRAGVGRSGRDR